MPNLDAALAIKIHCYYARQDDANGEKKKVSDLLDVRMYAIMMANQNVTISDSVAAAYRTGHYNMLLIRLNINPDDLNSLIAVGAQKLVCPWDDDTDEQKEYFTHFMAAGSCPLTGELYEEEDDDDELKEEKDEASMEL